jgi:hypothetical protein
LHPFLIAFVTLWVIKRVLVDIRRRSSFVLESERISIRNGSYPGRRCFWR